MGILIWICIALATGWAFGPVGAGAIVVAWVFFSLLPGRRAEAQERLENAAVLEIEQGGQGFSNDWTFYFGNMRARNVCGPDDGDSEVREYELSRNDRGQWRLRHTPESRDRELAFLARLEDNPFAQGEEEKAKRKADAAKVAEGKRVRLDEHLETLVETAYQRFLKQL